MCVGFFACNLNTNSTGQENPRSQNQAITMYLPESQKPTHMSDFFHAAGSQDASTGGILGIRPSRTLARHIHAGVSFSKSARRGQKTAICDEFLEANSSPKNPTWENADKEMGRWSFSSTRTHISTIFVHGAPFFEKKANGRIAIAPRAIKKALRSLKACRRASLSAWRGCQPGCDRRACASRLPSASRRVAPDRSTPPPHN